MSANQLSPSAPDLLQSLADIGVVGSEDSDRLDPRLGMNSLADLQVRLREAGHMVGALAQDALARPEDGVDGIIYDRARFFSAADAERAWAADYHDRSRALVRDRVDDWLDRLAQLRSCIKAWLELEFASSSIVDRTPVKLSEEIMARFGVPPRDMPAYEIKVGQQRVMRVLPKGLWVIGANGRVDLITKAAAPILADRSEPFARPTRWHVYDPNKGAQIVPLTAEIFIGLVRAGLQ